jgi:hypothetical protein
MDCRLTGQGVAERQTQPLPDGALEKVYKDRSLVDHFQNFLRGRSCEGGTHLRRVQSSPRADSLSPASADRPSGIMVLSPSSRIDVSFSAPTPQGQSSAEAAEGRQHSVEGSGVPMSPFIFGPWACAVPKWPLPKEPTWVTAARIETVVSQIRADWSSGVELSCVPEFKGLRLIATPESVPSRPMANENGRNAIGGRLSLRINHGV